jgi:hypothetical protein
MTSSRPDRRVRFRNAFAGASYAGYLPCPTIKLGFHRNQPFASRRVHRELGGSEYV